MTDDEIRRLMERAEDCYWELKDELDELVHDIHSDMAATVNNEGAEAQIDFLRTHMGEQETADLLKSVIKIKHMDFEEIAREGVPAKGMAGTEFIEYVKKMAEELRED